MDLEINGTYGCYDWMYAYNQFRSVTLCGRRGNERLNSLQSNEISIRFQSDKHGNKKGFWLYYEGKKLIFIYPKYYTIDKPKRVVWLGLTPFAQPLLHFNFNADQCKVILHIFLCFPPKPCFV